MREWTTSIRLWLLSWAVCCVAYTAVILGVAHAAAPDAAEGSLLTDSAGRVVGALRVAQAFTSPEYFWPRPSAADYNAAAASGSNLSSASPKITARADSIIARLGGGPADSVPADLVTASGSGLDPDITLAGALFQVPRVARARGVDPAAVERLVRSRARRVGGLLGAPRIVRVLPLNLALDRAFPAGRS